MNMFEKATKQKLRFSSPMGQLSVEDVWDLPLKHRTKFDLDTLAKSINRQIKEHEEESFVTAPTMANTTLRTKLDIVKYIIEVRMTEAETRAKAAEKRDRNARIMEILERKQNQKLEDMDEAELRSLLEEDV